MAAPSLGAVFFDAGGTLIHPRSSVGAIYAEVAARHGVEADPLALDRAFRAAFAAAPPLAFPGLDAAALLEHERAWWRRIVIQAFAGRAFARFDAFFDDLYDAFAAPELWRVYPDVVPALESLREAGVAVGVISNFDSRLVPLSRSLGLAGLVDSLTVSSQAGFAKPDPRIFEHALRLHGVRPEEAVHIGDSVREDIDGARAAGLRAFLVRAAEPGSAAGLEQALASALS